jgi:hypothetical protein
MHRHRRGSGIFRKADPHRRRSQRIKFPLTSMEKRPPHRTLPRPQHLPSLDCHINLLVRARTEHIRSSHCDFVFCRKRCLRLRVSVLQLLQKFQNRSRAFAPGFRVRQQTDAVRPAALSQSHRPAFLPLAYLQEGVHNSCQ